MGAAVGVFCMCDRMAFYREREYFSAVAGEHKYTLLGGVLGAFITITVIKSMGNLGPAQATMLIVIAQLVVSYLVELFGMFGVDRQPFEWRKLLGTAVAIGGIILFKWES